MNRRLLFILLLIFLLVGIAIFVGLRYLTSNHVTQKVVNFQGTVTDSNCVHTGPSFGGGSDCYAKLGDKTINYELTNAVSEYNDVINVQGVDYGANIPHGTKVTVRAFQLSRNTFTLDKTPGLYIRSLH